MANHKIMIISPDRYQAGVMCACLQIAGYQAASAVPVEGALDDLCLQNPDLLLLDWKLPEPGSLALVKLIRRDGCLTHVPLILTGTDMREEDVLLSLEAGADQCWREPFNPRVLVARVRAFLRRDEAHG